MALRILDGFDYYPYNGGNDFPNFATVSQSNGWIADVTSTYPSSDTAFGYGFSQSLGGNSSNSQYKIRTARGRWTSDGTYVLGQRMKIPDGGGGMCFGPYDSFAANNPEQWVCVLDYTGSVTLQTGFTNNGGLSRVTQAKTLSGCFLPGQWFYIEVKWKPAIANGFFEVRINTVPVLSLTTVKTANVKDGLIPPATLPGFDSFFYNCGSSVRNGWLQDDFYFLDDSGDRNDDYLGNVRVKVLKPVSDKQTEWDIGGTAPAATNWQSVLNGLLDDSTYVSASVVGKRDLYGVTPGLFTPAVYGLEVSGAYKQDDATQRVVRNTIRSAGVSAYGADVYTNQSYTFAPTIFELDPATGLPFTGAAVNLLQVGPEIVQ